MSLDAEPFFFSAAGISQVVLLDLGATSFLDLGAEGLVLGADLLGIAFSLSFFFSREVDWQFPFPLLPQQLLLDLHTWRLASNNMHFPLPDPILTWLLSLLGRGVLNGDLQPLRSSLSRSHRVSNGILLSHSFLDRDPLLLLLGKAFF